MIFGIDGRGREKLEPPPIACHIPRGMTLRERKKKKEGGQFGLLLGGRVGRGKKKGEKRNT